MKTKTQYAKERLSPLWQKKRLQIMERDAFACIECEEKEKTLNVHHSYYITGRKPWEYPNWSLVTLCEDCHKFKHEGERTDEFSDDGCLEPWECYVSWIEKHSPLPTLEDSWYLMAEFCQMLKEAMPSQAKFIEDKLVELRLEIISKRNSFK